VGKTRGTSNRTPFNFVLTKQKKYDKLLIEISLAILPIEN